MMAHDAVRLGRTGDIRTDRIQSIEYSLLPKDSALTIRHRQGPHEIALDVACISEFTLKQNLGFQHEETRVAPEFFGLPPPTQAFIDPFCLLNTSPTLQHTD